MKLSKALKVKNRLAGEVAQLQKLINESNVVEGANSAPHNATMLYAVLRQKQERLADLKGRIAVANVPIWKAVFQLSELKARISFLREMPVRQGKFLSEGRGYGSTPVEREYRATLGAAWVEAEIGQITDAIEGLQDSIDVFNATTEIDD